MGLRVQIMLLSSSFLGHSWLQGRSSRVVNGVSKSQQVNDGFDGNGGAHGRGLGYGFRRWWQDGFLMEVEL